MSVEKNLYLPCEPEILFCS